MILIPPPGWTGPESPILSLWVPTTSQRYAQPPKGEQYMALTHRARAGDVPLMSEWWPLVDEMMSHFPDLRGHGLDDDLREAQVAAFGAIRECTRLFASLPFLAEDRGSYRMLARRVHAAVERVRESHLRVDTRLRRSGARGALLALVNDALTVRVNVPLDPPTTTTEYTALIQTLDLLKNRGASRGPLFRRRGGMEITEAVVQELALVPDERSEAGSSGTASPTAQIDDIVAAVHAAVMPPSKGKSLNGRKPGNRTLEAKGELEKLNIYQQIHALYDRTEKPRAGRRDRFLARLRTAETHRDLREQIAAAGFTLDLAFIENALACIDGRKSTGKGAKAG